MLNRLCQPAMIAGTVVSLMGLTAAAHADQFYWDANGGTGGDWSVPANWYNHTADAEPATAPTSADDVLLTGNSSAGQPVQIASSAVANSVKVAPRIGASNYDGYLDIQANLTVTTSFIMHDRSGPEGHVTHSSGTLTTQTFSLSSSTNSGGSGTYDLTGTGVVHITGNMTASGGTNNVFTQNGANTTVQIDGSIDSGNSTGGDRWVYQLKAGSLTIGDSVQRGYGGWFIDQTGGSASVTNNVELGTGYRSGSTDPMEWSIAGDATLGIGGNVSLGWFGDGGTHDGSGVSGRFTLDGAKGSGSDVTVGGNWHQAGALTPDTATDSWGMLQAIIDSDAITTPADMRKIIITGDVTFDNAAYLLPKFDPAATPTAGTWTAMTWTGTLTDDGLTLAPGTAPGWSFEIVGNALNVTYGAIPEPATFALLGLGGLTMIKRRRDR